MCKCQTRTDGRSPKIQPGATNAAGSSQQGDFLDRGVGMAAKQGGKNLSREQEEQYSDYVRQGYQKGTGKVNHL